MSVLQTMGGMGSGSQTGGLTAPDVLLLHAKAVLKQASADDAVAAACKAVDAKPVTLDALMQDQTLLAKVKASELAMACVGLSRAASDRINGATPTVDVTDVDSMTMLASDAERLAAFCKDSKLIAAMAKTPVNAGTIKVLQAVNKDRTLLQSTWDATSGFAVSYEGYQDAPSNLDSRVSPYQQCLILVSTGRYSADDSHTNVFVNGTQVSDGTLVNTTKPAKATRDNLGAVALQPATFTETGDGYAAVKVMTPQ